MTYLHVTEFTEVCSRLPNALPLDSVLKADIDLFVCASGFEPRVSAVAESCVAKGYRIPKACYLTYRDNESENLAAREPLLRYLNDLAADVRSLDVDTPGLGFHEHFNRLLDDVVVQSGSTAAGPRVVLDISSASTRLSLKALHSLWARNIRLTLAYSQAAVYYPAAHEFDDASEYAETNLIITDSDPHPYSQSLGLESDVRDVEFSLEYPGKHFDNLPDRVVVVAGLNGLRSRAAIAYVDPALATEDPNPRVSWIAGEPLEEHDKWRLNAMLRVNGLLVGGNCADYVRIVSTFDYKETLRVLEEEHSKCFTQERISVAPMGSKMQMVGVSLFCELHPDVRVVLTSPASHEGNHYSEGVRNLWGVDFGSTTKLRRELASIGEARLMD